MVILAALRAFPIIFHRASLRLLGKTLLLTLAVFAMIALGLWTSVYAVRAYFGWSGGGLAEATATVLGLAVLGWLLFRTIATAVMSVFADDIVIAVERDSYPGTAATACPVGLARSLRLAARSVARTLGWNLLALPLYLLLLATGVGAIALFLALNAYLLGRDLADMVEPRHTVLPSITPLGRWLMGLVSALLFLMPLINLLAPIWSAAMAVHMLHGVRRKA
jgi:CysZ protein